MIILSIETSCDETALSIVRSEGVYPEASFEILGNVLLSQADLHAEYGGVFPNLAKREHTKNLIPLLQSVLRQSNLEKNATPIGITSDTEEHLQKLLEREPLLYEAFSTYIPSIEHPPIDAIAVTYGPGLEPALWVGINFAKALSFVWNIPIVPINHMEGHLSSALLEETTDTNNPKMRPIRLPALSLLVSGGHTELVLVKDLLSYEILGETRDDAVGEAFDKVARMLELPYPGGPHVSRLAAEGGLDPELTLPRPMQNSGDLHFSFSGIKTAVLYKLKNIPDITEQQKKDLCYEFQEAATDVLVKKTMHAAQKHGAETIMLGGGVSANTRLREKLSQAITKELPNTTLVLPEQTLSTDNALMIAIAAVIRVGKLGIPPQGEIVADGNLRLDEKAS